MDSATTRSELSLNLLSHSDGLPPSPPWLKSFSVRLAFVEEVTGGEHLNCGNDLPPHLRVLEDSQVWLGGEEPFPPPPPPPPPKSRAYVGADCSVIVALVVDATQLTVAVIEGFTWAIARYRKCREKEVGNVED